jgi:hypothetical protein
MGKIEFGLLCSAVMTLSASCGGFIAGGEGALLGSGFGLLIVASACWGAERLPFL